MRGRRQGVQDSLLGSGPGRLTRAFGINASNQARVTGAENHSMQLPPSLRTEGKVLRPVLTIGSGKAPEFPAIQAAGPLRLPAPASSLVVYEAVSAGG